MEDVEQRVVEAGALEPGGALLEGAGLDAEPAATVAETLVWTSLRGVDSHGVARVPVYVERLQTGVSTTARGRRWCAATARWRSSTATTGPARSRPSLATDLSIELAREYGVGVVSVRRSGHYGAAAFYAMRAADAGSSACR